MSNFWIPQTYCKRLPRKLREKDSEARERSPLILLKLNFNWKPAAEQWSIAQCLEHLAITSGKFDDYFSSALERARKKRSVTSAPVFTNRA